MQPRSLQGDIIWIISRGFVHDVVEVLGDKLDGIYAYGSIVFDGFGRDIDCHLVLRLAPTGNEKARLNAIHAKYKLFCCEVDAHYIMLKDARNSLPPKSYLLSNTKDEAWALHCAHIRSGCYVTLYGQEPIPALFPSPDWRNIVSALDYEIRYIEKNGDQYAYCILNLCRIIYSFISRNVAVSKRFSGLWACRHFPEWAGLIHAAMASYENNVNYFVDESFEFEFLQFYKFATEKICEVRAET